MSWIGLRYRIVKLADIISGWLTINISVPTETKTIGIANRQVGKSLPVGDIIAKRIRCFVSVYIVRTKNFRYIYLSPTESAATVE